MRISNKKLTLAIIFAIAIILAVFAFQFRGDNVAVLNPKGIISVAERNLIVFTVLLSLVVVIPVFFMTFYFAYKYREDNKSNVDYKPDWDHSSIAETIWWGVPLILIIILSTVTYNSSHDLDPFKPIESNTAAVNVQVVAMQWKWLFIYPEYGVASVNYLPFPEGTPVHFDITSDAPMNSFWIPELGGQIYAMSGMNTQLNLMADKTGTFSGSSANISGKGFSKMRFTAESLSQADFDSWVDSARQSPDTLNYAAYDVLARPGEVKYPISYALASNDNIFHGAIMKYMILKPAISDMGSETKTSNDATDMSDMNNDGMGY